MGCCLSTKRKPAPSLPKDQNALTDLHGSRDDRAPQPPPPTEEETVKEVLSVSETAKAIILSPKPNPPPLSHIRSVDLKDPDVADDAVSEPARSELSSSTVTYEEEREVRSSTKRVRSSTRVRARPEWNAGAGRDRVVGRSPSRRSDLSPARRAGGGASVRLIHDPNRKDAGSVAGARSRSPAANRSIANGRNNPAFNRRVSQSPARVRANSGEGLKKAEENGGGSKWPSSNPNYTTEEAEVNPNESLEDPHVSLECFIFL